MIYIDPRTDRQYTFEGVKATALSFGQSLRTQWNWQTGDVVGIYSANCIDTPAIIFGTLWANGVVSPANSTYTSSELAFQLSNSGAKALITQRQSLETALAAAKIAGIPRNRILLMGDERNSDVLHFEDFLKTKTRTVTRRKSAISDLAFIPYSSGTTGLPKGVMLTHRNMVSNVLQLDAAHTDISEDSSIIAVLPFFHSYGQSN